MADAIEKLDYTRPPVGSETTYEAELAMCALGRAPTEKSRADALRSVWAWFKLTHVPPGLRPHPWAKIGDTFKHALVTPSGATILETVGVTREIALAAGWRWYDIRLDLANSGKPGAFDWPGCLDDSDADLLATITRRARAEEADRAEESGRG